MGVEGGVRIFAPGLDGGIKRALHNWVVKRVYCMLIESHEADDGGQ